jgi:cyanophycinase-like exopeptidase
VEVIGQEAPGEALGFGTCEQTGVPFDKGEPVTVIGENVPSLDAADHDVLKDAGMSIRACLGICKFGHKP